MTGHGQFAGGKEAYDAASHDNKGMGSHHDILTLKAAP
jgi:hypothetical protein